MVCKKVKCFFVTGIFCLLLMSISCSRSIETASSDKNSIPVAASVPANSESFIAESIVVESPETASNSKITATEAAPVSGGTYKIIARHSGKVLEVQDGLTKNGANVQLATWAEKEHQTWVLVDMGQGIWRISPSHVTKSGLRLSRDNVAIRKFDNESSRLWNLKKLAGGYYQIASKGTSNVITIDDASTADGANASVKAAAQDAQNQQFILERVGDELTTLGGDYSANTVSEEEGGGVVRTPDGTRPSVLESGLVAYWKFDEAGENDVCKDSSGNGYDAKPQTAINRGTGKFGAHCISLAGDQVLDISRDMPEPSHPMSFSAWIKPANLEGRQYIMTYLPGTPEDREQYEYAFHLDNGGEPRFWMWGHYEPATPKEKWGLVSKEKVLANQWSHVAVTIGEPTGVPRTESKEPGAVNLTYTLYLNGQVVDSQIYPVPPFRPNMDYSIGGKPSGEYSMHGDIDELMVFSKTLTAQDVEDLYKNGGKDGFVITQDKRVKPRIIVTQDGEGDDKDSMVRFLAYSSDYDVVGIVENNSIFQPGGHSSEKWIQKKIDAYAKVLKNLRVHNPDYPDPEYLKSVIVVGNENPNDLMKNKPPYWKHPKDFETKDTPGSDLIIKTLLDNDPRPVHVPSWGGANTTAYALWKIKTQMPDKWDYAASRIRIHCICYNLDKKAQDGGIKWIIDNMPEVKIFQSAWWSRTWNYDSHGSGSFSPPEVQAYMSPEWLTENVKTGHGALGETFGQDYVSEGDTPSWLNLINNGLYTDLDYTLGGWGGRAVYKSDGWMVDGVEDPSRTTHEVYAKAFYRWIPAAQNDYAARMDWCVAEKFEDANHNPKAKVNGKLVRAVKPGEAVTLDASGSTDPDGNTLTYKWWQYHEADSIEAKVEITNADSQTATFVVPDEPGKQVFIILEVTDDGTPALTNYQRVFCNIQ